jgi:V/A-type H+-transporting ATPase subunit D
MIHPTRTTLLQLEDKAASLANSVAIFKARRQALIKEFVESLRPFLRTREAIRTEYGAAIAELQLSKGHEGLAFVETLAASSERQLGVEVAENNVMGVRYRELTPWGTFVRSPQERDYGYAWTSPHLEESICHFEKIADAMVAVAMYEGKLRTLGDEIQRVTRRTRVVEERMLPRLQAQIRSIAQYLGERDREAHFRLKRFKTRRQRHR